MNDTVRAKPGPVDSTEPPPSLFTATIATIPYINQRYETVGDWIVRVSNRSIHRPVSIEVIHDTGHGTYLGDCPECAELREEEAASPSIECVSLDVAVSVPSDWRHAALVGVHELIEAVLCHHRGITQTDVDNWDYAHRDLGEPGDAPGCPYRREHQFATVIEKLLAAELGVDWRDYCAALDSIE